MYQYSKFQVITVLGAIFICVLLYFAPNKPKLKVVEVDNSIEARVEQASEFVSSGKDPMKGIMMLRDVLKEDSTNLQANFQLGLFSLQSKQFDKAMNRFQKVLAKDNTNSESKFYLGVSYANLGDKENALKYFEMFKSSAINKDLIAETEKYINELKN